MLQAWQTCMDRRWSTLHPHAFMRVHACGAARALGIHTLNLGATPHGADGLAAYKARWGGTPVSYPAWLRFNPVGRLADVLSGRRERSGARSAAAWDTGTQPRSITTAVP
jgi:hypothetical protein